MKGGKSTHTLSQQEEVFTVSGERAHQRQKVNGRGHVAERRQRRGKKGENAEQDLRNDNKGNRPKDFQNG
jgi:hypothetical protein